MAVRATLRPVFIASFEAGTVRPLPPREAAAPAGTQHTAEDLPLRRAFPKGGEERHGGTSDGYCFRITFAAGRLDRTYAMVSEFLSEQGYGDIPLPADADELRAFRLPSRLRQQLTLFEDDGYVHNPVRILFPPPGGKRGALLLQVYDETSAGHLLRFHGRKG